MFRSRLHAAAPAGRLRHAARFFLLISLTGSGLWRVVMAFLMVVTFVVGMWSSIVSPATVASAASGSLAISSHANPTLLAPASHATWFHPHPK